MILETKRLRLRPWSESDTGIFEKLHSDPIVMADQGGPIDQAQSAEKLQRYISACRDFGYSRWCIETHDGWCVGYCGVMPVTRKHPLGPHDEIGWRLFPDAWSNGYATEAATVALKDVFERVGVSVVYSYTAPDNERSKAVMNKLGLTRDISLDFITPDARLGEWHGLVWKQSRGDLAT